MSDQKKIEVPYIPPQKSVREITVLSLALGAVLSIVMGAANTYLGLYAGMTVSASIPAAVISMAILRGIFRRGSILENNIVQTMASTGESLAAGVIFTVPALVMVGAWQEFKLWPTTMIVGLGGVLGIIFMIPMRRALIVDRKDLIYPEGVACAEVLKTGDKGGGGIWAIVYGVLAGGIFKALVSGCSLISSTVETAVARGQRVFYMGSDMSVALMAVGYIVNLHIAVLITIGGVIGWFIAIPLLGGFEPGMSALELANELWSTKVRYLGVGAMLVGGVYSIWSVRGGIVAGITGLRGVGQNKEMGFEGQKSELPRTQRDMSLVALMPVFIIATLATLFFYNYLIGNIAISLVTTILMVVTSFLFVAVATYIAGLVGSSNSPVSGMTICALLISAGVLLALGISGDSAILATLGVAGVVCCATCTSGDVAQDLKTGQLVGATPAKLQWAEIIGAIIPAACFAPILTLLHNAYGIGTGEPGSLRAPQAALFASLSEGFFGDGELPWNLVIIGALIGVGLIVIDTILKQNGSRFRVHVMPVAVGIYLPVSLDVPIFIGGLLRFIVDRVKSAKDREGGETGSGVLFGSGLIAGEALMGIGIAIYLAAAMKFSWLRPLPDWSAISRPWLSLSIFGMAILAYIAMARRRNK